MVTLLRSALRYALQHRWQTGLNILGILIGVMMVVAVDLANTSARQAFEESLAILNGNITHQVVAGSDGVPDNIFVRLKTELGIRKAAPGVSGQVMVGGRELTLIGIDLLSELSLQRQRPGLPRDILGVNGSLVNVLGRDNQVVMAASLASSLSLQRGDQFNVATFNGTTTVELAAEFVTPESASPADVLLVDIATAQHVLGRTGRLDSIDLVLDANQVRQLENWLPANMALVQAQARNDNIRQMSDAFHINLLAMSLLSLLVAGLLIYNTVTLSVLQRRETLGIFRAQGVSRRQLLLLVFLENGVTGFLASLLGVGAGYWLGRFLVTMVTGTVNELYFDLSVSGFMPDPLVLLKGLLLGTMLSLGSSALPAFQAARAAPVTLQHKQATTGNWLQRVSWLAVAGVGLMAAGGLLLLPEYGSLVTGFVALTLVVFGFCLLVPLALYGLLGVLLRIGQNRVHLSGIMALRNARTGINRTGLAVAALCVAVSVTIGVGVMVGSFRGTVILWLEQSLPGDLQLTAVSGPVLEEGIPDSLRRNLDALASVTGIHNSVLETVESEFGQLRLGVNDIPAQDKFLAKALAADGIALFNTGQGVFISEPLAYLQQVQPGDDIRLLTDSGMTPFPVAGVFYDYTSDTTLVHMHENLFRQHWNRQVITRLTLDMLPGVEESELQAQIRELLAGYDSRFNLVSNRQLREFTLQIFDRTFDITNVLRLLAILVAFVGVFSTLLALQLEKGREFAILRATGMTPGQTAGLIFKQTTVLGICAGLLALPLGLLMSDILIDVINRRSFGWTMQHFLPQSVLLEGFALAVVAAVMAGCYPAWRAGKIRPAVALREE